MQRKILIVLSFLPFLFAMAGYVAYTQKADSEREFFFREQEEKKATGGVVLAGPYCFPDRHPGFLFSIVAITGVTFVSFCLFKRPFIPAIFAIASVSLFPYWFVETRIALSQAENFHTDGLDMILYRAGAFDVVVFVLTLFVAFWQVSVVLRAIIRELGRKKILP